jgi:hypothetical protein
MHMDHVSAASPLMQIVNILSNKKQPAIPLLLKFSQGKMGSIRLNCIRQELTAAGVIESVHPFWKPSEGLRSCDIFEPNLRPDSISIAEGFQPRLSRDPSTGENHNVLTRPVSRSHTSKEISN